MNSIFFFCSKTGEKKLIGSNTKTTSFLSQEAQKINSEFIGGKAYLSLVQPPWISGTADFSIGPDDQILEQHPYMQAHTIAPLSVIMNLYQTLIE